MEKNVQKTDCDQCWCLGASPEAELLDMEIWRLSGGRKVFAYSDYIYGNVLQYLLTSLKGVLSCGEYEEDSLISWVGVGEQQSDYSRV